MPFRKCSHPSCKSRFFSASGSTKICPKCRINEKRGKIEDNVERNNNIDDQHAARPSPPSKTATATCDDMLYKVTPTVTTNVTATTVEEKSICATGSREDIQKFSGIINGKLSLEERQDQRQESRRQLQHEPSLNMYSTNQVLCGTGIKVHVPQDSIGVSKTVTKDMNSPEEDVVDSNPPSLEHEKPSSPLKEHIKRHRQIKEKAIEGGNLCDEAMVDDQRSTRGHSSSDCKISDEKYVCFVCGSDLSHLRSVKGRVNHIKRCGKKYSVTARDIVQNDDEDIFVDASNERQKRAISSLGETTDYGTSEAPIIVDGDGHSSYASINVAQNEGWHKGAEQDLKHENRCNGKDSTSTVATAAASSGNKQTILSTFFQRPQRSLNDVLLGGARRLAKSAMITARANESASTSKSSASNFRRRGTWRRGWSGNNSSIGVKECPSYKKITGTDFICDGFYYAKPSLSSNYFLTHFHSDHYGGITPRWNVGVIYCSLPTANLVSQQLGVDKKYLHPIAMMTPTVIESRGKPITVTLIDANHCPGAVMFLFEVGNKRVLHVGDFRWNRFLMMKASPLQAFSKLRHRLDEIYLDTTYCDEKYVLPTQQSAISETICAVERELADTIPGKKKLFLFGSYTIGKERIYMAVAQHFKKKIYVDKRRYKILCALDWPRDIIRILTTDKSETNIWVVPLGHINFKRMGQYDEEAASNKVLSSGGYSHIIGFRPTGWSFSAKRTELIARRKSGRFVTYAVPYSEHSSFTELVDCLLCLKPKKIIPTVSVSKSAEQCELLLTAVRRQQQDHIP